MNWRPLGTTFSGAALCVAILSLVSKTVARAEEIGAVPRAPIFLGSAMGPNPDQGMLIGDWILYTSFFTGGVFNDNVYNSTSHRTSAFGQRLRPRFEAERDDGIHRTRVHGVFDAQIYWGATGSLSNYYDQLYPAVLTPFLSTSVFWPGSNVTTSANSYQGRAGFSHIYSPMRDLTFSVVFDFTRQLGLFGSGFGAEGAPIFVPSAVVQSGVPRYSNQLTGFLTAEKKIDDRSFVEFRGGVQGLIYDNTANAPASYPIPGLSAATFTQQNGINYTASARLGYWAAPTFYLFVEPGGAFRRYQNYQSDTNGYQILGGLGSDRIGLFRGEVYAGYQRQLSSYGLFWGISSPAFGARIYYYPTPYFTISATADQTLGSATPNALSTYNFPQRLTNFFNIPNTEIFTGLPTIASGTRSIQARLQGDYSFSPVWSASIRGGFGETRYADSPRVDAGWMAGLSASYTFWRNVALTVDYNFARVNTNAWRLDAVGGNGGYVQNLISFGATYRY